MKVSELIEALQKMPQEANVVFYKDDEPVEPHPRLMKSMGEHKDFNLNLVVL